MHIEGARKEGDRSLNHSGSQNVDLPSTPKNGWKTGHPSPKKAIQAKKPKYQEVKNRSNGAKNHSQTRVQ
jgi:hypothetical protein